MVKCIIITITFLFLISPVKAETTVLINEVLIDPLPQAVELINTTDEIIDVSNWYLDDNGGTSYYTIPASTILIPNSCVLISGDFNLNKSSADIIRLFDNTAPPTEQTAQLINSFTYTKSPGSTISFQRSPDQSDNWIIGSQTLGKINETGINCLMVYTSTPSPSPTFIYTPTPSPSVTPTPTPPEELSSINAIFISEIMVYPDTGQEWIEFYNDGIDDVLLENWYLDDVASSGANLKQFSLEVPAKSYASYDLSISIFNNDGDNARLLNAEEELIDIVTYNRSSKGLSVGRRSWESSDLCLQNPTKNLPNTSCLEPSPTSSPSPTKTVTPTKTPIPTTTPNFDNTLSEQSITSYDKYSNNINGNFLSKAPVQAVRAPTEQVLGDNTARQAFDKTKVVKTSLFASFSYSFLAILSVLLKIKQSLMT